MSNIVDKLLYKTYFGKVVWDFFCAYMDQLSQIIVHIFVQFW